MDIKEYIKKDSKLLEDIRDKGAGAIVPEEYLDQLISGYFGKQEDSEKAKNVLRGIVEIFKWFQEKTEGNYYVSLGHLKYIVSNPDVVCKMINKKGQEFLQNESLDEHVVSGVKYVFSEDKSVLKSSEAILEDIIRYETT